MANRIKSVAAQIRKRVYIVCASSGNGEFETEEKLRDKKIAGSFTLVDHP